jgi:Tfp pilus assembly protein PilX
MRMMTRNWTQNEQHRARSEHGNMVVAVSVMMVLAMLSAAVVARTLAGLRSTRQGQDFSAALANADAGVSDALFRIDQLGSAAASAFCVGPDPACTVSSVPGAPDVQYT